MLRVGGIFACGFYEFVLVSCLRVLFRVSCVWCLSFLRMGLRRLVCCLLRLVRHVEFVSVLYCLSFVVFIGVAEHNVQSSGPGVSSYGDVKTNSIGVRV